MDKSSQKIVACLRFDGQAEEAVRFYVSLFRKSSIGRISRYGPEGFEVHRRPAGSVMTVEFTLDGQRFTGLNGGPVFTFNEAGSLQGECATRAEADHFWDRLSAGGDARAQQCGWLKDRYGLCWQGVPSVLAEPMRGPDPARTGRVKTALLQMKELDIAAAGWKKPRRRERMGCPGSPGAGSGGRNAMKGHCRYCRTRLERPAPQFVTRGLCDPCAAIITRSRSNVMAFMDTLEMPLLFLEGDPRRVVTANRWARELFAKELPEIEGRRGGEVFDCENSFSELGCGADPGCADCGVKNALVDTLVSGRSHHGIRATLPIRKAHHADPHDVVVATERIGRHALLRIDCFTSREPSREL